MEKNKKQKQERQIKLSLKTANNLLPSLLTPEEHLPNHFIHKVCPQITTLNSLRIFTLLEITYILELYLQIIQKHHPLYLAQFKIGIIGGGVTARLIINTLLALSKDGLQPNNIIISTRQTQNLKFYADNFGIRVHFDNQATAAQADLLIIATPATLDNWIIADLRQILQDRVSNSNKKNKYNNNSTTLNKLQSQKSRLNSQTQHQKKQQQKSAINEAQKRESPFRPLLYILTSDFSQQKCKRYFTFPVLTPSVRAKDMPVIQQTVRMFQTESAEQFEIHQKILAWWLFQNTHQSKKIQSVDSQSINESLSESKLGIYNQKYSKSKFHKIVAALSFITDSVTQTISATSSISNTVSISESGRGNREQSLLLILEIIHSQGEIEQTFFRKLRKWRMAHNNFIA